MDTLKRCASLLCVFIFWFGLIETAGALTFNSHDYLVVKGLYTWEEANNQLPSGYHLATITSMEEHNFIANNLLHGYTGEYWLGAFQDKGTAPESGWHWVTNEPWSFVNWAPGEPNEWNGKLEDHLGIWSKYGWQWNDEHGRANIRGFIAESSPIQTPEPSTIFLLGISLLGLTAISQHRFRKR